MKSSLCFVAIAIWLRAGAQTECPAIIDWQYTGPVEVFDHTGQQLLTTLRNDSANENFLYVEILGTNRDFLHVSIAPAMDPHANTTGWIKKAAYVGAYLQAEHFPTMELVLHNRASTKSRTVVVPAWQPGLLAILECTGEWTLVRTRQNGKEWKGWIETDRLCANAYTTCG